MLNERDRFSKEKGRDFDVLKDRGIDINKMAKQELAPGVPLYYFNMSNDFITKNAKKLSSDPEFIKALKLVVAPQSPFRNSNLDGKTVAAAEKILSKAN